MAGRQDNTPTDCVTHKFDTHIEFVQRVSWLPDFSHTLWKHREAAVSATLGSVQNRVTHTAHGTRIHSQHQARRHRWRRTTAMTDFSTATDSQPVKGPGHLSGM
jgi:hypothetical protein